jgi:hypothetical protein
VPLEGAFHGEGGFLAMKTASNHKRKLATPVLSSDHFTHQCGSCDSAAKSIRREFSDQAWAALVSWSEVSPKAVHVPICNDCYLNFRDVLIERADEMRLLSSNIASNAKAVRMPRAASKVARA